MAKAKPADDLVALDPVALDCAACGQEFQGRDYFLLGALGLLVPLALLVWGWL